MLNMGNELELLLKKRIKQIQRTYYKTGKYIFPMKMGTKESPNDKKCLLEARLEGRTATCSFASSNTYDKL